MIDHEPDTRSTERLDQGVLQVRAATVEVVAGPDVGRRAQLDRPIFVIGSGDAADLRLRDGTVSREHLRLGLTSDGLRVRDGDSKNGTWMGGVRVHDALLTGDTTLQIGATALAITLAAPLELPISTSSSFGAAIGVSTAMRHVFAILERAALSDVTVLLEGESGVGKELLAHGLHAQSPRAAEPFVTVDCAALPANLIEAELFGHERGAFTGASEARTGVFEHANGGTVFLDEIGELPLELQPKLLRVLEQRQVRPVGANAPRPVDVRVVAATNRRLAEAVQHGSFRADLFYRLAVVRVTVPPLRDRPDDIPPIAAAMLRGACRDPRAEIPPDLAAMLRAYHWPGNARELRNVIERYTLLGARGALLLFDAEPRREVDEDLSSLPYDEARRRALARFERRYFPRVLERAGGVVARAAELAEVARPSFYRMLERVRAPRSGR